MKPRIRVFTKSLELIVKENNSDKITVKPIYEDWMNCKTIMYQCDKNSYNPNFSQKNYFYNLRT